MSVQRATEDATITQRAPTVMEISRVSATQDIPVMDSHVQVIKNLCIKLLFCNYERT